MRRDIFNKQYAEIVAEEKKSFFENRIGCTPARTRRIIVDSWKRCRQRGQNPDSVINYIIDEKKLADIFRSCASFIAVGTQTIESAFPAMLENAALSLADRNGVLLKMWHSQPSYRQMAIPGTVFTEQYRGTGALTLSVLTREPQECFSAEHYYTGYHKVYSCSAPIYDMQGNIAGFIGMSTEDPRFLHHIRMSSKIISQSIATQIHLNLLLEENKALLNILEDAMLILDSGLAALTMNDRAVSMLRLKEKPVGKNFFELVKPSAQLKALLGGFAPPNQEIRIQTRSGAAFTCVATFSKFEGHNGGALFLRDIKPMRAYAVRTTGSFATYHFNDIIAESPIMKETLEHARKAADTNLPVLIYGESGVGKELIAHSIHNAGTRGKKPFIAVNCGALPKELVQSELFGYSAGAFTGARAGGNPGKFELADGGTLFLDEVGEMPLDAQVNLLRLLQNGELMRIGGKNARYVDVRIIAATNRNLEDLVKEKIFRLDLFYRLNAITIAVPALRDRPMDLKPLALYFFNRCRVRNPEHKGKHLSAEALEQLQSYDWPGNVRELENAVEYAVYMATGDSIQPADMPEKIVKRNNIAKIAAASDDEIEKAGLEKILMEYSGNVTAAVKALGTTRSVFYRRMRKYGLSAKKYRVLNRNDVDAIARPAPACGYSGYEKYAVDERMMARFISEMRPVQMETLIGLLLAMNKDGK